VVIIINNIEDIENYEEYVTTKNTWRTHKTKAVGALEGTDITQQFTQPLKLQEIL
jgi:hypothetical protein